MIMPRTIATAERKTRVRSSTKWSTSDIRPSGPATGTALRRGLVSAIWISRNDRRSRSVLLGLRGHWLHHELLAVRVGEDLGSGRRRSSRRGWDRRDHWLLDDSRR